MCSGCSVWWCDVCGVLWSGVLRWKVSCARCVNCGVARVCVVCGVCTVRVPCVCEKWVWCVLVFATKCLFSRGCSSRLPWNTCFSEVLSVTPQKSAKGFSRRKLRALSLLMLAPMLCHFGPVLALVLGPDFATQPMRRRHLLQSVQFFSMSPHMNIQLASVSYSLLLLLLSKKVFLFIVPVFRST